jgi:hypothetical protein
LRADSHKLNTREKSFDIYVTFAACATRNFRKKILINIHGAAGWDKKFANDNFNDFFSSLRLTVRNKRARLSAETDHDTGSESPPSSPRLKNKSYSMPLNLSPSHNRASPSSPESELDVDDSAPDDTAPENLSLKKKERSKSPAGNNNFNNNLGFLPYQQPFHQPNVSTSPTQRSPVDVLLRYCNKKCHSYLVINCALCHSQSFSQSET